MTDRTSEELILAYWRSWQTPTDFDEMESYLADDVVFNAGAGEMKGKGALRALIEENPEPWTGVTMIESQFWSDGGVIIYEGTGTESGTRNRIAELLRVDGDEIVQVTANFAQLPPA